MGSAPLLNLTYFCSFKRKIERARILLSITYVTICMELYDLLLVVGINVVVSSIITFFWRWLWDYRKEHRLSDLENDIEQLKEKMHARYMVDARASNKEEEEAFLAQASTILAGEGELKDKVTKLLAMNPGMALKFAKKLGLGKLI